MVFRTQILARKVAMTANTHCGFPVAALIMIIMRLCFFLCQMGFLCFFLTSTSQEFTFHLIFVSRSQLKNVCFALENIQSAQKTPQHHPVMCISSEVVMSLLSLVMTMCGCLCVLSRLAGVCVVVTSGLMGGNEVIPETYLYVCLFHAYVWPHCLAIKKRR